MNSSVSKKKADEMVDRIWEKSLKKHSVVRRKCPSCFLKWEQNGRKTEEKPSYLPEDYRGKCPICGSKLLDGAIPF